MTQKFYRSLLHHDAFYFSGNNMSDVLTAEAVAFNTLLAQCGRAIPVGLQPYVFGAPAKDLDDFARALTDIYRRCCNWAPLRRVWWQDTDDTWEKRFVAWLLNLDSNGLHDVLDATGLPCGHVIPDRLYDLENYNGCPLCGSLFHPSVLKRRTMRCQQLPVSFLKRWTMTDIVVQVVLTAQSPLPLDSTQRDDLEGLMEVCRPALFDNIDIACAETRVFIAATLRRQAAQKGTAMPPQVLSLLRMPDELLKMLWYDMSGQLRLSRPKDYKERLRRKKNISMEEASGRARLHVARAEARAMVLWLARLPLSVETICQSMNRHRQMWVRLVRALRMSEYVRRFKGTDGERLKAIMEGFYHNEPRSYAGQVEQALIQGSPEALSLLFRQPGYFARMLFTAMLHCGAQMTLKMFSLISRYVSPMLLVSLASSAPAYFLPLVPKRVVRISSGKAVSFPQPKMLEHYTPGQCRDMAEAVQKTVEKALAQIYAYPIGNPFGVRNFDVAEIYIDPRLDDMPVPAGDRSDTISLGTGAVQGQRFDVKGNAVRLFMHWGAGMPAQHYDMDLSSVLVFGDGQREDLAYYNLQVDGGIHSGDIQYIPDNVGAAEYIELDLDTLQARGCRYVIFSTNAYSMPELDSNLMVGWMDSAYPMHVDDKTGVSYDPANVSYSVTLPSRTLDCRGMTFGVLDVEARQVVWLEMFNDSRMASKLQTALVLQYMGKIENKVRIGALIRLYAAARGIPVVDEASDGTFIATPESWTKIPLFC